MAKGMFKQERFSFRKMKVGLASVAILFAFAQLGQVSADETSKVSSSEITKVTEAPRVVEEVKSPIEEAKAEIATEKSRPTVKETEAKAGDLIDVSKKESAVEVKESQEGNQKVHIETSVAEVTKTEIAPEKVEKIPEPVTTTKENTVAAKDKDGNSYTQYERVDKTTTVEITKTPPTVKKAGEADIVFVVDRSGSMSSTINTVRKNVNEFARNLAKDGVAARFGLATYSDEVYGRRLGKTDEDTILTKFGETYFTTNPVELEKALEKIKIAHGGDSPETATPALTKIVSTYDWSKSPKNKKFVVLLTDARMKEDPSIPSIAEALTTLKKAGIDRIVATTLYNQRNFKDFVSEGRLMDIDRNLADSLTKDAASWIVETVGEGRQYKVTKDSYQFYLERRTTVPVLEQKVTPKPAPTAYKPAPAKLPETGSNDSSNQTLLGLGIMLAGFGLATSARKSKEQ